MRHFKLMRRGVKLTEAGFASRQGHDEQGRGFKSGWGSR